MSELSYRYLGRAAYEPTWALQRDLAAALSARTPEARETLLAVEHDPVITIGRRGSRDDVLASAARLQALGVDLHEVDRGGEVTYHGPGQLVLYPVVRVTPSRFGVGDLVRGLAAVVADAIEALGIASTYDAENPGLWVGDAKICAVGMRVSRGVSTHGAALNVTSDLDAFRLIVPCGMPESGVTSVARELGDGARVPSLDKLAEGVARRFADRFGFALIDGN